MVGVKSAINIFGPTGMKSKADMAGCSGACNGWFTKDCKNPKRPSMPIEFQLFQAIVK